MKHTIIIIFLFVSMSVTMSGQEPDQSQERIQKNQFKNAIYTDLAVTISSYNAVFSTVSVEYISQWKRGFEWGIAAGFDKHLGTPIKSDRNTIAHDRYMAEGMIYYRQPVFYFLSFRAGLGIGLGYHVPLKKNHDNEKYGNLLAPYFSVKLQWVFHISRKVDLTFSPLFLGQSHAMLSPMHFGEPSDNKLMWSCDILHLGLGIKF